MQIVEKEPRSSYAESFRSVKTNIKYSAFGKDKKIILITSANPGEGKSTTASNLALTLSMDNKKVILIDCDLRRSTIHKFFNISGESGLSELIIKEKKLKDVISKHSDNLDIITAGNTPPNPAELLASEELQDIFDELRELYDYIIIDTTPLGVVADAQILTSKVDGTILVARQRKTKKDKLINCKKMIEQVNGKIIGVIINRVDQKGQDYYYYY